MATLDERIHSLDTTLFEAIPSSTSENDRRAVLLLQDCVRTHRGYIYLEIGSYLGGTIQPHFVDPACKKIYSIDKRPEFTPDERGQAYHYENNSTELMLRNLHHAFPSIAVKKISTFDSDVNTLNPGEITEKPNLCFVDGEHTNQAVFSDFKFCLQVSHPDAIIAFHDTCYIFKGIKKIKKYMSDNSIRFRGYILGDSVYAILLNKAPSMYADKMRSLSVINENGYFSTVRKELRRMRWDSRRHNIRVAIKNSTSKYPPLYQFLRTGKKILESLTRRPI